MLTVPVAIYAVDVVPPRICGKSDDVNKSAVCTDKRAGGGDNNPITGPGGILTKIINLLTVIVAIVAVITIILAGLKYITSGSNPEDVKNARERVIYAVIALVIAGMAQFLVRYIIGKVG